MPSKKKYPVRIGIMGGGFDPFHLGHLNSLLSVKKKFNLQKIIVVPSFQPPLMKASIKNTAQHRLKMLKITLQSYDFIEVDDQEIKRKGTSYSYRTVENISKNNPETELFFIVGLDQFQNFDKWKEFKRLLKKSNIIVTSRPLFRFPKIKKEFPQKLRELIKSKVKNKYNLKTGYAVYFHKLRDKKISSSLVREKLNKKERVTDLIPASILKYIKKNNLYRTTSQDFDLQVFLKFCVEELENKKAFEIKTFDLTLRSIPFSAGLIASSSNVQHCKSLFRHLQKRVQEEFKIYPIAREGVLEGKWIVLDYNDVVIHIFYNFVRDFYNLEEIWKSSS